MHTKEISLNNPQAIIHLVNANKTYSLWGRATGKTNGGLGPRIVNLASAMPRAQIGLIVPTYEMAFSKILPNVSGFWQNEMGLIDGENYVIGKKPPDEWVKPIIPIFNYKYVVSFDDGTAMPIISLAVEGAGNGFNCQAFVGDEAKFFKEKNLKEVKRALRGGFAQFGHLPEFQSEWYFTDKYEGDIEWMLAKRKLMNHDLINAVIRLQLEINEAKLNGTFNPQHATLNSKLNTIRKDLVFVSEASALENAVILGKKYFDDQKADSTKIEFAVAIENKDPTQVENCFYSSLSEKNLYTQHHDVDPAKPLIIAADYQWRISPIVTAQIAELPGNDFLTLNFVYSCHTLHPEKLKAALELWCTHFKKHPTRIVYFLYDKTATNKHAQAEPLYETVITYLRNNDWVVIDEYMGEPPQHHVKHKSINEQLDGTAGKLPIMINELYNEQMLQSIELSPAKTVTINGKTKTMKDKSSEKNLSFPAVKSTHFGDTFDMILNGVLDLDKVPHQIETGFDMRLS